MSDESQDSALHYRLLKTIAARPEASQRQLAAEMGISLGKVNYCLKALVHKGVLKAHSFSASSNKRAYAYYLTPEGARMKAELTRRWFARVQREYEELKREVALLDEEGA